MPDRNEAFELNTHIDMRLYQSLVYRWLNTFPKPAGVPDWPAVMPEPTLDEIKAQVEAGIIAVGDPEDCARVCQQYENSGGRPAGGQPHDHDHAVRDGRGEHEALRRGGHPPFRHRSDVPVRSHARGGAGDTRSVVELSREVGGPWTIR